MLKCISESGWTMKWKTKWQPGINRGICRVRDNIEYEGSLLIAFILSLNPARTRLPDQEKTTPVILHFYCGILEYID